eukprot:768158-Hanusia_phi.AAC.5
MISQNDHNREKKNSKNSKRRYPTFEDDCQVSAMSNCSETHTQLRSSSWQRSTLTFWVSSSLAPSLSRRKTVVEFVSASNDWMVWPLHRAGEKMNARKRAMRRRRGEDMI